MLNGENQIYKTTNLCPTCFQKTKNNGPTYSNPIYSSKEMKESILNNDQIDKELNQALTEAKKNLNSNKRKGQGLVRYAISRGETKIAKTTNENQQKPSK